MKDCIMFPDYIISTLLSLLFKLLLITTRQETGFLFFKRFGLIVGFISTVTKVLIVGFHKFLAVIYYYD